MGHVSGEITRQLDALLCHYENTVNVDAQKKTMERQKKAIDFETLDRICIEATYPTENAVEYTMEEIHGDMEKMMYSELISCNALIEIDNNAIPMIRANYGVGILPSEFGVKSKIINNDMPWVEHISKGEVLSLIDKGIPDYGMGFCQRIIDTYEFYSEKLSKYPKCKEVIKFYHPDFQGPFDVAHLIYGSNIYLDMYEDPDTVHALISLVTDTYIDRMKRIKPLLHDENGDCAVHWKHLFPGHIVLRNDSAVNISADMYNEFVRPYDEKIAKAFGSASMHFCGRADHWVFDMANSEALSGFNFGHMDRLVFGKEYLDFIAHEFTDKKRPIVLYVLREKDLPLLDCKKYQTGLTYTYAVSNKTEAEEIISKYTF